jgi:electron transfer flavoprotein beta subunit
MTVLACLKWVTHPGEPHDERFAGASPADRAALELALQHAAVIGTSVTAVTVGPKAADRVLRDAFAAGAARLVRVDTRPDADSTEVADAIAHVARRCDASWVWCGDYSLDRGTGSVPAFVAAALGARQALGSIAVLVGAHTVEITRRLDGGRRELLEVEAPAVLSVEGSVATLRRASLAATRSATTADVEVLPSPAGSAFADGHAAAVVRPYRPRARALAAPTGESTLDRLRVLTDAAAAAGARGETVHLPPAEAAARIVDALDHWGWLPAGD